MRAGRLAPYEQALRAATPLDLVDEHGRVERLDVLRWLAPADAADETVLRRCVGPVLDLGCGPGRLVHALTDRGVPALGVDLARDAVALTRRRGGAALHRDIFAPLPGERRWPTVLLLDGNVGIGADPARLLTRVAALLDGRGRLLAEVDPQDRDERRSVRFARAGVPLGGRFDWAHLGLSGLRLASAGAGLQVVETWRSRGRVFAQLHRR